MIKEQADKKKWYDDYSFIYYATKGKIDSVKVCLPNSGAAVKEIEIDPVRYNKKEIKFLVDALDCALLELINRDKAAKNIKK